MRLSILLQDTYQVTAEADRDISDLTLDSRQVKANDVFIAIKGTHLDGRQYIASAIAKGAAAILIDADSDHQSIVMQQNVPLIPVYQLQSKLGQIAARFYAYPTRQLCMIGVTGTSGKTSCTHFIAQLLQSLQIPCGIIGTLGSGFYGALGEVGLTTPDAITLQATLREFVSKGAKAIAMEVSSHSIDQGRVNTIPFEIGIFTNLTQDHLDYHGNMDAYAAVKQRFFTELPTKHVIINADDAYGKTWIPALAQQKSVYAYTTQPPMGLPQHVSAIYAEDIQLSPQGTNAFIHSPWGEGELSLPLIGRFNLSNALAVLATLCVLEIPFSVACHRLSQLNAVAGRMQTLGGHDKPLVIVDYAHKPDALEKVLQVLRTHTKGKLICVFGCGGERDQSKRPLMAKIAEQIADRVIVTNDNPRHEQPEAIAEQILHGFIRPERVTVLLDRSKAIQNSIQLASVEDCILIAGKGAEHYQQIGDEKIPFDDVEQVLDCLDNYGGIVPVSN